ncbi:STAS domain-containing protein [Mycobacterium sp. LTG2003]
MTAFTRVAPIDRTDTSPATFDTRWLPPATAVISVHGEIDAANASGFTEYAMRHTAQANGLVLDLSGVAFFGTAGFSALKAIETRCSVGEVDWMLIPSNAVARLLRICDPDSRLRRSGSVAAALTALRNESQLLQLVTKPR